MSATDRPPAPKAQPATLIRLSAGETGPCLVFCPDVGGNVLYARVLIQALGAEVSSLGLRLAPDMLDGLATLTLEETARRFATDLIAAGLGRPLHLVGFSFAGYVAAETARQLTLLGHPPERLWILDMPARRKITPGSLWHFARSRFSARRAEILHRPGFLRIDLSRHPEGYRPIIRRLYALLSRYRPKRWDGSATVVVAEGSVGRSSSPDLGWGRYVRSAVTCVKVPGDHLGMMHDAQHASVLAARFQDQFRSDSAAFQGATAGRSF